ncbi:MAG: hypothetical protein ACYCOU_04525 [Sulfobacillus sp.]
MTESVPKSSVGEGPVRVVRPEVLWDEFCGSSDAFSPGIDYLEYLREAEEYARAPGSPAAEIDCLAVLGPLSSAERRPEP